jgi:hypothetical protein
LRYEKTAFAKANTDVVYFRRRLRQSRERHAALTMQFNDLRHLLSEPPS